MRFLLDLSLYTGVALCAAVTVVQSIRHKSSYLVLGGLALCGLVLGLVLTSPLRTAVPA